MKNYFKGKIDAVILCHGVIVEAGVQNCVIKDFDQAMLVNVRSNVHLMSLSFPFLKQSPNSSITMLTSVQGNNQPDPRSTVLSMTSAMQQQLVKCSALEGANFNLRVNAVAAGTTYTKARMFEGDSENHMYLNYNQEQNEYFMRQSATKVPLGKTINSAKDVASALLFLASEDASMVTGEIMVVDGGQSLTSNTYDDYLKAIQTK